MTRVTLISSFSAVSGVPGTSSVRRWSCPPRSAPGRWAHHRESTSTGGSIWCGCAAAGLFHPWMAAANRRIFRRGGRDPCWSQTRCRNSRTSAARAVTCSVSSTTALRSALASLTSSRTSSTSSRTAAAFGGGLVWRCRSCRSLRICASRFEAQGKHRFMFRWASLMSVGQSAQVRVSDSKFCPPFLSSN